MIIKARELKEGDMFLFNDKMQVAIEPLYKGSIWVTSAKAYLEQKEKGLNYGYENATIIQLEPYDDVDLKAQIDYTGRKEKIING